MKKCSLVSSVSCLNIPLSYAPIMTGKMDKLILSANSGSSSLYALASEGLDEPVELLLHSSISNISAPPAKFTFKTLKGTPEEVDDKAEVAGIDDHASAFEHFLKHLKDAAGIERGRISHVCHRVVHGGDYRDPVELSSAAYHHIERLSDLAPL